MDEFKKGYLAALDELTFNSKPIINNLTMMAQTNIPFAPAVVDAVQLHISRVKPQLKLPALYLLDSICKNVGPPYTDLFAQNLYKTITEAYTLVDNSTRTQIQRLFLTWLQPMFHKPTLFPEDPTKKLERFFTK
ncbi:hypothetical protein CANCADRAFT_25963, partial [Tortispora caseinolytica NRRL Y-17796]